jgi:hypothetical protein
VAGSGLVTGVRTWTVGVLAAGLVVAGCDGGAPGPDASPSPSASTAGCARVAAGRADAAATLRPGPSEGKPKATAAGEALVVDAVVLDEACAPAAGAALRIWHTDARGLYGPKGGDDCCFYEALGTSDHSGRFRLETIRPAQYPEPNAPAAHIHVRIDHRDLRYEVTMVFGFGSPPATVMPTDGPVVVPLSHDSAGWRGEAVVVLSS